MDVLYDNLLVDRGDDSYNFVRQLDERHIRANKLASSDTCGVSADVDIYNYRIGYIYLFVVPKGCR